MGLSGVSGRGFTLAAPAAAAEAAAPTEPKHSLLGGLLTMGAVSGVGAAAGWLVGSKLLSGHGLAGALTGAALGALGSGLAFFNSGSVVYDPYYDPYPYDPGPSYDPGPDYTDHGGYAPTSPGDDYSGGSGGYDSGGTSSGDDSSTYGNPDFQ